MTPAERLLPPVAPPVLRLLERPPRLAQRAAEPVRPGFWQRWAERFRRAR